MVRHFLQDRVRVLRRRELDHRDLAVQLVPVAFAQLLERAIEVFLQHRELDALVLVAAEHEAAPHGEELLGVEANGMDCFEVVDDLRRHALCAAGRDLQRDDRHHAAEHRHQHQPADAQDELCAESHRGDCGPRGSAAQLVSALPALAAFCDNGAEPPSIAQEGKLDGSI